MHIAGCFKRKSKKGENAQMNPYTPGMDMDEHVLKELEYTNDKLMKEIKKKLK